MGIGFDFKDPTGGFVADLPGGSYLFESSTEEANRQSVEAKKKAAAEMGAYAPDAMRLRRESLQQALSMFGPLGGYIQRMTGQNPMPDVKAMFAPLEAEENTRRAALPPKAGDQGVSGLTRYFGGK
jgi:hypothetical protein